MTKKNFIIAALVVAVSASIQAESPAEQLFSLENDKQEWSDRLGPFFDLMGPQLGITKKEDKEKLQAESFERYYKEFKEAFVKIYSEKFTDAELKEILGFYNSTVGKKWLKEKYAIADAMQPAQMNIGLHAQKVAEEIKKK